MKSSAGNDKHFFQPNVGPPGSRILVRTTVDYTASDTTTLFVILHEREIQVLSSPLFNGYLPRTHAGRAELIELICV